jgi:hypothetical protein
MKAYETLFERQKTCSPMPNARCVHSLSSRFQSFLNSFFLGNRRDGPSSQRRCRHRWSKQRIVERRALSCRCAHALQCRFISRHFFRRPAWFKLQLWRVKRQPHPELGPCDIFAKSVAGVSTSSSHAVGCRRAAHEFSQPFAARCASARCCGAEVVIVLFGLLLRTFSFRLFSFELYIKKVYWQMLRFE